MDTVDRENEPQALGLLADVHLALSDALNSFGGMQLEGIDRYRLYTTAQINRAVEGFLYLRNSGRDVASRLLVRTAIEAGIRLRAVSKRPELFFRINFTEFKEDKKWVLGLNRNDASDVLASMDLEWLEFKRHYKAIHPDHQMDEKTISLWELASSAGIESYYESHYRLYCRHTHATFQATAGVLDGFLSEDTRTMILCGLSGLAALQAAGSSVHELEYLNERFSHLE